MLQKEYIHIALADDDEDDRLFFTDAFSELKMKTKVDTFKDGHELMLYLNQEDAIYLKFCFGFKHAPEKRHGMFARNQSQLPI